jgi:RimJ/RimL family protein N-acetyltransferase
MILEKIVPQAEIATERFTLRPVRKSDAGLFALYAGDKRVAEATQGIPHPLPPGAADAFCTRAMSASSDEDIWVMDGTRANLPEVLGVISLKKMDRGQSEVAFWVAPRSGTTVSPPRPCRRWSRQIRKRTAPCSPRLFRTIRARPAC